MHETRGVRSLNCGWTETEGGGVSVGHRRGSRVQRPGRRRLDQCGPGGWALGGGLDGAGSAVGSTGVGSEVGSTGAGSTGAGSAGASTTGVSVTVVGGSVDAGAVVLTSGSVTGSANTGTGSAGGAGGTFTTTGADGSAQTSARGWHSAPTGGRAGDGVDVGVDDGVFVGSTGTMCVSITGRTLSWMAGTTTVAATVATMPVVAAAATPTMLDCRRGGRRLHGHDPADGAHARRWRGRATMAAPRPARRMVATTLGLVDQLVGLGRAPGPVDRASRRSVYHPGASGSVRSPSHTRSADGGSNWIRSAQRPSRSGVMPARTSSPKRTGQAAQGPVAQHAHGARRGGP